MLYLSSFVPRVTRSAAGGKFHAELGPGLRKSIKFILLFLFAVLLLWFFGRDLDWALVTQSLRKADPYLLAISVLVICLGYLLRAVRWQVLLSPITETSLKELFATTTVGFAAIFLVGRAGELVRPMWLPMRDRRVRPSAALVTLGLERILDLAAIVCFFAVNLLFFTAPSGREGEFKYVSIAGVGMLVIVAIGFIFLILYRRGSNRMIGWVERLIDRRFIPGRVQRIVISVMRQLESALAVLSSWREALLLTFWTFTLWLAIAVPTWLVLLAFDLPMTFSDSLFIMGFAVVSSVVPTPGGAAGAFHTGTGLAIILLNGSIRTEDAAAVAIAMHLVYFAPAIVFGLYYFAHGDISIERFRVLLSSDHAAEEIESEAPGLESPGNEIGMNPTSDSVASGGS